jgi:hypothetical protein
MKSSKLFPGPKRVPKRVFASSAGSSEYKHNLPDTDGFKDGMLGWKAGRSAGGTAGANRQVPVPFHDKGQPGEGGFAYDSSCAPYLTDKGKP